MVYRQNQYYVYFSVMAPKGQIALVAYVGPHTMATNVAVTMVHLYEIDFSFCCLRESRGVTNIIYFCIYDF